MNARRSLQILYTAYNSLLESRRAQLKSSFPALLIAAALALWPFVGLE